MSDAKDWTEELREAAGRKEMVLHVEQGVVGVASRFWEAGTYIPTAAPGDRGDGQPLPIGEAVLELEDGNAFLVRPGAFLVLPEGEAIVYRAMVSQLRQLTTGAVLVFASAPKPDKTLALALVRSALRAQLRALGTDG